MSGKAKGAEAPKKDEQNAPQGTEATTPVLAVEVLESLPEEAKEFIASLQAENAELKANPASESSEEVDQLKQAVSILEKANEKLEAENAALAEKAANSTIKKCDGTYEAESGKLYAFKQGFLKVSVKGRGIVPAEEAIKDATIMESLISMRYGGLEIVKPAAKGTKK